MDVEHGEIREQNKDFRMKYGNMQVLPLLFELKRQNKLRTNDIQVTR